MAVSLAILLPLLLSNDLLRVRTPESLLKVKLEAVSSLYSTVPKLPESASVACDGRMCNCMVNAHDQYYIPANIVTANICSHSKYSHGLKLRHNVGRKPPHHIHADRLLLLG